MEECCGEFRVELLKAFGGKEDLPDDWTTAATVITKTGRKMSHVDREKIKPGGGIVRCS